MGEIIPQIVLKNRDQEQWDNWISYACKIYLEAQTQAKLVDDKIAGISIINKDGDYYIHFYTKQAKLSYPLFEDEDDPEWNECIDRLKRDVLPDICDINEVVTKLQEDAKTFVGEAMKVSIVLRNVKIAMMSKPYILFSKNKPIHEMSEEEFINDCVLLVTPYDKLGFDPDVDMVNLLFGSAGAPVGFSRYLINRSKVLN